MIFSWQAFLAFLFGGKRAFLSLSVSFIGNKIWGKLKQGRACEGGRETHADTLRLMPATVLPQNTRLCIHQKKCFTLLESKSLGAKKDFEKNHGQKTLLIPLRQILPIPASETALYFCPPKRQLLPSALGQQKSPPSSLSAAGSDSEQEIRRLLLLLQKPKRLRSPPPLEKGGGGTETTPDWELVKMSSIRRSYVWWLKLQKGEGEEEFPLSLFFCHSSFFSDANDDDEGEAVLSRFFGSPAGAMVKDRRWFFLAEYF